MGKDGAKYLAEDINVPFLGDLPLVQGAWETGDLAGQLYYKGGAIENALQVLHNH
ncbi:MAG: hypothetical protein CM15mP83_5110 [Flavobacteriaceae bacterium]|nr:MAG: hypothetical protein CM15mP83_5110 [Flavobacteriaceae bacterium]